VIARPLLPRDYHRHTTTLRMDDLDYHLLAWLEQGHSVFRPAERTEQSRQSSRQSPNGSSPSEFGGNAVAPTLVLRSAAQHGLLSRGVVPPV
jgi:hypothetical protein